MPSKRKVTGQCWVCRGPVWGKGVRLPDKSVMVGETPVRRLVHSGMCESTARMKLGVENG